MNPRRMRLQAIGPENPRVGGELNGLYFHLYDVTDRDNVSYIYSTLPIVERDETEAHSCYQSCELCL